MTALPVLFGLLPIVAGFALTRRRRLDAIIGMAVFSLLLASVFFLLHAPDVAITEAAIGAALVTFVYVLAIRKTGRLTVAASEVPGLIERVGAQIDGLEYEILERLAGQLGLDLVVQFVARGEIEDLVARGEADLGAGGLLAADSEEGLLRCPPHLPTARFVVASKGPAAAITEPVPFRGYVADAIAAVRRGSILCMTVDLARFLAISRQSLDAYDVRRLDEEEAYAFVVGRSRGDLHRRLSALVESLMSSGELDEMTRRHFP